MSPRTCIRLALAGLAVLVVASLGVGWSTARAYAGSGLPPGIALALVKVVALAIVFRHVRNANVYSMQWSSMFILLFFAEGVVRATTDPQPAAAFGAVEAIAAACVFAGILGYLRPIKKQAKTRGAP